MKKIKSIMFTLVMALFVITVAAACGKKTTKADYSKLKIQSVSASAYNANSGETTPKMMKLNAKLYDDVTEPTVTEDYNYFVIWQSNGKATITVTVANPDSVDITMLKIASTDEEATIKTYDNGTEIWQKISDYPYVKWNGSNAYKTTFDVETTKNVKEVEFSVVDLKVNDEWIKSTNLGNNKLHVYKIADNAIEIETISKDIEKYVFDVKVNDDNITITNVTATKDSDNHYTVTESQTITIAYTYKLGTTGLVSNEMNLDKEVSLVKITASILLDEETNYYINETTGEFKVEIKVEGNSSAYIIDSKNGTAENNMFVYTVTSWDGIDDLVEKAKNIILTDELEYNGINFTFELSEGNMPGNWIFTNK